MDGYESTGRTTFQKPNDDSPTQIPTNENEDWNDRHGSTLRSFPGIPLHGFVSFRWISRRPQLWFGRDLAFGAAWLKNVCFSLCSILRETSHFEHGSSAQALGVLTRVPIPGTFSEKGRLKPGWSILFGGSKRPNLGNPHHSPCSSPKQVYKILI